MLRKNPKNFLPIYSQSFKNICKIQKITTNSMEFLQQNISQSDPKVAQILECERKRQRESIVLIASENFTSRAVMDALGSHMQNKYSEGYPGARYYSGNEFTDQSERLCQELKCKVFLKNGG